MLQLILTLLMHTYGGEIFSLIETLGFGFAVVLTTVLAGHIYLRVREPNLPRPIKVSRQIYKIFSPPFHMCISKESVK